jgi:hypothetical protein
MSMPAGGVPFRGALPIIGIIATHDLELSKMQESDPTRFHNYCFEITNAREKSNACIGVSEREQTRPKVKSVEKIING